MQTTQFGSGQVQNENFFVRIIASIQVNGIIVITYEKEKGPTDDHPLPPVEFRRLLCPKKAIKNVPANELHQNQRR